MDAFIKDIISRQSNNYSVEIIADSISAEGDRITSMQLRYPRFIHAEMMTHKRFSRNASSSRARPVEEEIKRIMNNPAIPIYWGAKKAGMQAVTEVEKKGISEQLWLVGRNSAVDVAKALLDQGLHKQTINRILEPYQLMEVVITATSFEEFFALRIHPDAQPEIIKIAYMMKEALDNSTPWKTDIHLPYVSQSEFKEYIEVGDVQTLMKLSSARCARVSYKLFDGTTSIEKDIELADKLFGGDTPHASPAEHPALSEKGQHANFKGWKNYRTFLGV